MLAADKHSELLETIALYFQAGPVLMIATGEVFAGSRSQTSTSKNQRVLKVFCCYFIANDEITRAASCSFQMMRFVIYHLRRSEVHSTTICNSTSQHLPISILQILATSSMSALLS